MPKRLPSRTKILDLLESDDRPWSLGEIASSLDVASDDEEALERILDGLVLDGEAVASPGRKYRMVPNAFAPKTNQKPCSSCAGLKRRASAPASRKSCARSRT